MGCRLPKLRKAEERRSPGNIYSTLRRPQVETKVGVAYTYHFLDFLLGKEEVPVSSVLCLSSVRELPVQVRELYAQGFVLVAVHPFVHPCGPRHAHIQRQLHRAVLVRETPSTEKSQLRWARHRLETDVCAAGHPAADPEVIQSYVKRIQDVAEQGVMFVGFLQQPGGAPCFLGNWDPDELSSLHSSPSPIHRHPFSANASPTDPAVAQRHGAESDPFEAQGSDHESVGDNNAQDHRPLLPAEPEFNPLSPGQTSEPEEPEEQIHTAQIILKGESTDRPGDHRRPGAGALQWHPPQKPLEARGEQLRPGSPQAARTAGRQRLPENHSEAPRQREGGGSASDGWLGSPQPEKKPTCVDGQGGLTQNNNHIRLKGSEKEKRDASPTAQARMQLFALYNYTGEMSTSLRFYSLRVPLQVQREGGQITEVDAHWLDHMTQHFTSGAHLIDGFFHLADNDDNEVSSVDSVFIFRSSTEEAANASYDAIVVEQWTIVDGVVVKADYIPLLQSLAPYGWRLMCVLPTPIVKTNSDGSLSTKQILFLQRPVLQRKRKDFKMPNLRGRAKAKKASAEEPSEERENRSPVMEMDSLRRGAKEEEEAEGRRGWGDGGRGGRGGRSDGARPPNGAAETGGLPQHQRALLFLPGSRVSLHDGEEETDIDSVAKPEKSVRWTDVCQRDGGRAKEEAKAEERIKQQLFSGVC